MSNGLYSMIEKQYEHIVKGQNVTFNHAAVIWIWSPKYYYSILKNAKHDFENSITS